MGFKWSYWGLDRAYAAGVQEYEVNQALRRALPRPMRSPEGLRALIFWGRTDAGRGLLVMTRFILDSQWDWEIVEVRELTADEDAELARWENGR